MYSVKELYRPASLEEALKTLKENPDASLLAGGTDVLVKLRKKKPENVKLISISQLSELKGTGLLDDGTIAIGPCTTFTEIGNDPVIREKIPMLAHAALSMGGPQIQNVATIGGNVCNGAVSADSAPSLFALDAQIVLRTSEGERTTGIEDFYLGPGKVKKNPDEIMVKILIPPRGRRFGCRYIKFSTRKAMDLAILGAAAAVTLEDDKEVIRKAALALGVAAPVPVRCKTAEAYLQGKTLTKEVIEEAGRLALTEANPRDSWRASKRYREALIKELSGRALEAAYKCAGGETYDPNTSDVE